MKITRIVVENLFGTFNHTIPLNIEDRITIIHGPNGFGKTILLKMLNGLFNKRYSELTKIPFATLKITFDDNSIIQVTKEKPSGVQMSLFPEDKAEILKVSYERPNKKKPDFFYIGSSTPDRRRFPLSYIEREVPELERIGPREWRSIITNETLSLEDIADRYDDRLPLKYLGIQPAPEWWNTIIGSVKIHLVDVQRLTKVEVSQESYRSDVKQIQTVKEYSSHLAEIIQQNLAVSTALSQSLDRTFPARLVRQRSQELTEDDIRQKLNELEKERSRLRDVGLHEKQDDEFLPSEEVISKAKDVLTVYIQDNEKKLNILDDIADKIVLFRKIINNRFLYKEMSISKEKGFYFTSGKDHKEVPLEALSSGEQHEIVLLYQLLFKVAPNSLILIDEPEISLHVLWQTLFLKDLEEITKLSAFDVLIATHSPSIVNDRWDLTVDLQGPAVS